MSLSTTSKYRTLPSCFFYNILNIKHPIACIFNMTFIIAWPNHLFKVFCLLSDLFIVPSPSFPACSAAPPGRILENMLSPSMPGWPAAALPIPPGLGAALEPAQKNRRETEREMKREEKTDMCAALTLGGTSAVPVSYFFLFLRRYLWCQVLFVSFHCTFQKSLVNQTVWGVQSIVVVFF